MTDQMTTGTRKPTLSEPGWKVGVPVAAALGWAILVVLGCALALIYIDYSASDSSAKGAQACPQLSNAAFVVLVRNIALIGAAAIALPLSIYIFWMKDRSFRVDFRKAIQEAIKQRDQEAEESRRKILEEGRKQGREEALAQMKPEDNSPGGETADDEHQA